MVDIKLGTYAYRFDGYAMGRRDRWPWFLVGVGTIKLKADKSLDKNHVTITGYHRSTISLLHGHSSKLYKSQFKLKGIFKPTDSTNRLGPTDYEAEITFREQKPYLWNHQQILVGTFSIVPANDAFDQFWLISTGANNISNSEAPKLANEVVKGEARWISNS